MASPKKQADTPARRLPPARTVEARVNQLITLSMDLVEKRLMEGTASAQETVHFLRLGTVQHQIEQQKLVMETEAIRAKIEQAKAAEKREEIYAEALAAMRRYQGQDDTIIEG